ncbi:MAG: S8 family serine peptidase [Thermoplasmata archaeon]|nr:MAG: S8 family serine peptidase [Thermoplasmata archaeon]
MTASIRIFSITCLILFVLSSFQISTVADSNDTNNHSSIIICKDNEFEFVIPEEPWWTRWVGDLNRNGLDDSIDLLVEQQGGFVAETTVNILIDYDRFPMDFELSELEKMGLQISFIPKYINTIGAQNVPLSKLQDIKALDGVVMIEQQSEYIPALDVSVPAMKIRPSSEYSNVATDFDVTGDGITIAVIDTGVDDSHDGLDGKYVVGADYSGGIISRENPDDKDGHGTHCAGIALGDGGGSSDNIGVAPDAKLVDVKVFNDWSPTTSSSNVMQGIQWCIDNKDTYDIDILSLSVGEVIVGNDDGLSAEAQLVDAASDAGLVVIVAAGNEGPNNNGFSSLAAAEKAITVGAIDDGGTVDRSDDVIADFSSRGPRADDGDEERIDEFKPDISVPGVDIDSTLYAASAWINPGNGYTEKSGTSMAAPHVAGLAALLLEANPTLSPEEIKTIIRETATQKGQPYNSAISDKYNKDYGWGIADGYEAVKRAFGDFQRAEITSFENGDTIGGIVEIFGTASNDKGAIVSVELSFDSGQSWYMAQGTYDWNYTWDSTEVSNGNFAVYVRTSNGTAYSESFRFQVTILNVLARISYPYPDTTVKGTVRIEGTLSTGDSVELVEIQIDEGDWFLAIDRSGTGSFSTWYYDWYTETVPNGWHTINVRTHTSGIFSKENSVRVQVDNPTDDSSMLEFVIVIIILAVIIAVVVIVMHMMRKRQEY